MATKARSLRAAAAALLLASAPGCGSGGNGLPPGGALPGEPGAPGDPAKPGETGETGDAGCTLVSAGHGAPGTTRIRVERIASGLVVPWAIAFLPGGDVLVTERPGRVRLLRDGALVPGPVLTVSVSGEAEEGLLGVAVDPAFETNRRIYVYYTENRPQGRKMNRLVRYVLAEDRRSATVDQVLLDDIPGASVHDGGRLRFGRDGMLYVATGEAGVPSAAQDPANPAGKILRITTDGAPAPGNPVPGSPVLVSGVRNVQGFDWLDDGETLAIVDHGPSGEFGRRGHDELTIARPGANLGWPDVWRCEQAEGVTSPRVVFTDAMPPAGAVLYRGDAIPAWKGSLLVATLRSKHLQRVVLTSDGRLVGHEVYLVGDPPAGLGRIREVTQAPDGSVWLTTSNCDGRGFCPAERDSIVRIVAE